MNKVILIGNLANDPELRHTANNISCCQFRLAVQRRYANEQGVREADFIPIITWRGTADLCAQYLAKGRKCAVVGELQTRSYEAQDGTKRYVTEVVADSVEFLANSTSKPLPTPPPERGTQTDAQSEQTEFTQVDDDELPF